MQNVITSSEIGIVLLQIVESVERFFIFICSWMIGGQIAANRMAQVVKDSMNYSHIMMFGRDNHMIVALKLETHHQPERSKTQNCKLSLSL